MSFGITMWKYSMNKNQNYVTWIQIALQSIQKQMAFAQTVLKMLKRDLILRFKDQEIRYIKEKIKK